MEGHANTSRLYFSDNKKLDAPNPECEGYCDTLVKPLILYIPSLHKQLKACKTSSPPYGHDGFQKINKQLNLTESWQTRLDDKLSKFVEVYNKNQLPTQSKLKDIEDQLKTQLKKVEVCEASANVTESNLNDQRKIVEKYQSERKKFRKIGHKYYYIEKKETDSWLGALQKCAQWGGHLVSLKSEKEWRKLIRELKKGERYWIDLTDRDNGGKFISATTDKPPEFLKWHPGEPTAFENSENCVEIGYVSFKMNDNACQNENFFICESDTE